MGLSRQVLRLPARRRLMKQKSKRPRWRLGVLQTEPASAAETGVGGDEEEDVVSEEELGQH